MLRLLIRINSGRRRIARIDSEAGGPRQFQLASAKLRRARAVSQSEIPQTAAAPEPGRGTAAAEASVDASAR